MAATQGRHPVQLFALVVGVAYLAIGVIGFGVTGFEGWVHDTAEDLLGFDLNAFHNVVHLGVGALLVGSALPRDRTITEGVLIGGGLVYVLAAFLGFTGDLDNLLSIDGTLASDNFLHLVSGVLALGAGLASVFLSVPEPRSPREAAS